MSFFDKNKHNPSSVSTRVQRNDTMQKFFGKLPNGAKGYAYVHLNIKNFKQVNFVLGYEVGDALLKSIVEGLQGCTAHDEMTTHIMVDEFALLLKFESQEQFTNRLLTIMAGLENIEIVNDELVLQYKNYFICGIYEITGKESSLEEISYIALNTYMAVKQNNDGNYGFFDNSMQRNMQIINKLQPLVQDAFDKFEIAPCFQVIYEVKTKRIAGANLLPKWIHPEFGAVDPLNLTSVIEQTDNTLILDLYLLEAACKTLQVWINDENVPIVLSVNISKYNLYQSHFVDKVMGIVNQYQVPANLISLKFEASIVEKLEPTIFAILTELHNQGFMLSVDGFGKNHVSLSMFYEFPVDCIYLNAKFVKKAQESDLVYNVLCSVISLARQSNVRVLAEAGRGSHNNEEFLQKIGCNFSFSPRFFDVKSVPEIETLIF